MDRFTWMVVGGIVGLVVVGLGAATLLRRESPPDLTTPAGVVLAYALAEQRGDPQAAWDLLASSTQARADHDRFLARASFLPGGDQREYLTTEDERIDANGASVVLVRSRPASGGFFDYNSRVNRITVRLVRQGPDWRISVPPDEYLFTTPKP